MLDLYCRILPKLGLSLAGGLLLLNGQQLLAQIVAIKYVADPTFSALSRKGTPKDISRGGGKRGVCTNLATSGTKLAAVMPPAADGGLSATTRPVFWVYMPYTSDTPMVGVLSIRSTDSFESAPFQKVKVPLPSQPGFVRLKLPESISDRGMLAWTLTVVCDEINVSRNPFVGGLVTVKPDPQLLQRVAGLSQSERIAEFARSGYWYDTLDLVASRDGDAGVKELMRSGVISNK